jgi:hypothetical protein
MLVTADVIIKFAALIGACFAIIGAIVPIVNWFQKQKEVRKDLTVLKKDTTDEISNIKKEQTVMCYSLLACLDGLNQLGANGNVSKAREALEKHLNLSAHE